MRNNLYTPALTFKEICDYGLRVGLVRNSKVVLSKRLCFRTLRLHTSIARRYGCYAFVSRAALLPLAYDGYEFPILRWCKEAVSLRGMINQGSQPFMRRQSGTKVRPKSMTACSLPCVPRLMISPATCVQDGALYNNDHLLSFCLQPQVWHWATSQFRSVPSERSKPFCSVEPRHAQ